MFPSSPSRDSLAALPASRAGAAAERNPAAQRYGFSLYFTRRRVLSLPRRQIFPVLWQSSRQRDGKALRTIYTKLRHASACRGAARHRWTARGKSKFQPKSLPTGTFLINSSRNKVPGPSPDLQTCVSEIFGAVRMFSRPDNRRGGMPRPTGRLNSFVINLPAAGLILIPAAVRPGKASAGGRGKGFPPKSLPE